MFEFKDFMGRRVLTSSLIDDGNVIAFFTTRDLPLKVGEREDLTQTVESNKKLVCQGLSIPIENIIIPQQSHSDNVEIIDAKTHRSKEAKRGCKNHASTYPGIFASYTDIDALITDQRKIALVLNFADCVPIIFYDSVKKVIASTHAGWRGTAAKIGVKTVQKMVKEFGCKPKDIIALIGPAIGNCCFEVKEEVKEKLLETMDKTYYSDICENNNINLKLINKLQLLAIRVEKIDVCEYCTSCQNELFFSYRKENGNTARHSTVVMLKG